MKHVLIIIIGLLIAISCSSCEAYVDYLNNTPVRTQYIERPYYPNNNTLFYPGYGVGYYHNFYNRPVIRPVIIRHQSRIRPTRPVRRVVKPRPIPKVRTTPRTVRPVRSGTTGNTLIRRNVGRRGQKQ